MYRVEKYVESDRSPRSELNPSNNLIAGVIAVRGRCRDDDHVVAVRDAVLQGQQEVRGAEGHGRSGSRDDGHLGLAHQHLDRAPHRRPNRRVGLRAGQPDQQHPQHLALVELPVEPRIGRRQ